MVLEIHGHYLDAHKFDEVHKFLLIVREHQPVLYEEIFEYLDPYLIQVYCDSKELDKLKDAFSYFIQEPLRDIDRFYTSLLKAVYYGYTDLAHQIINQSIDAIRNAKDNNSGPLEKVIGHIKFFAVAEELHATNSLSHELLCNKMDGIGEQFTEDEIRVTKEGLNLNFEAPNLIKLCKENNPLFARYLQAGFHSYMQERGVSFTVSGVLSKEIFCYLMPKPDTILSTDEFFTLDVEDLHSYLGTFNTGCSISPLIEKVSFIWGSVYFYDFFKSIGIITDTVYNEFIEVYRILKARTISSDPVYLWQYNFVHQWPKPDGISETEFIAEKQIFSKGKTFNRNYIKEFMPNISDELTSLGEYGEIIKQQSTNYGKKKFDTSIMDHLLSFGSSPNNKKPQPVAISEPKTGRNDPCTCGSGKKYKKCCGK